MNIWENYKAYRNNLAYQYTVTSFTERELAKIISFHNEEMLPIKEALTIESWEKVNNYLNEDTHLEDNYYIFKTILLKNKEKAENYMDSKLKENPNTIFGISDLD